MSNAFTTVHSGARWPSGDYRNLAILPIDEEAVTTSFGSPLLRGNDEGLGSWAALGLRHNSGVLIELIRYNAVPGPNGFLVRIDRMHDASAALTDLLAALKLQSQDLPWVSGGA